MGISFWLWSCNPRDPQVLSDFESQSRSSNRNNNRSNNQGAGSSFKLGWSAKFDTISASLAISEKERLLEIPFLIESWLALNPEDTTLPDCLQLLRWTEGDNRHMGKIQLQSCALGGPFKGSHVRAHFQFEKQVLSPEQTLYRLYTLEDEPKDIMLKENKRSYDVTMKQKFEFLKLKESLIVQTATVQYVLTDSDRNTQHLRIDLNGRQEGSEEPRLSSFLGFEAYSNGDERAAYFSQSMRKVIKTDRSNSTTAAKTRCYSSQEAIEYEYEFNYKPPMRHNRTQLHSQGKEIVISTKNKDQAPPRLATERLCNIDKNNQNLFHHPMFSSLVNPSFYLIE